VPTAHAINDPEWKKFRLVTEGSAYKARLGSAGVSFAPLDVTPYVDSMSLTEQAGEAAQVLEFSVVDTTRRGEVNPLQGITVGTHVRLTGPIANPYLGQSLMPNEKLFNGLIFKAGRSHGPNGATRTFRAYDPCTYFSRTEDTQVFVGKTFTAVFLDMLARHNFTNFVTVSTGIKTGKIIMGPGWTVHRLFLELGKRTFDSTGRAYHVRSNPTRLRGADLLTFGGSDRVTWNVIDGLNGALTQYDYEDSAENVRTHVIIVQEEYDEDGEFKALKKQREGYVTGELREVFGDLIKLVAPDSTLMEKWGSRPNWWQIDQSLKDQMAQELANVGTTAQSATLKSLYIPGIRVGDRINAGTNVGEQRQNGWIVESVQTTWQGTGVGQDIGIIAKPRDSALGFVS